MSKSLTQIRIILVEPAGALNVGSVARIMKNMGLQQLILVNPQCDSQGEEAQRMAVHGKDVLQTAQIVETLPQALQGCQRAIATTARSRHLPTALESPHNALEWLLPQDLSTALIFGPEYRGLSNSELNYAQRFVGIPANPDYPSLNLAQAVTVCAYELYQLAHHNIHLNSVYQPSSQDLASLETLESYFQQLETLLLNIGYLQPQTASAKMEKFRRLYNRAQLRPEEVALLRGILRQTNWAIQSLPRENKDRSFQ